MTENRSRSKKYDTTFYEEQLKTLMSAVHRNIGWLDGTTNNEYLAVLLKGFIEDRSEKRLEIHNLTEFVKYFSQFLSQFERYMNIESYFLTASPHLKEEFLHSALYVRLPEERGNAKSEEQMQNKIKQINRYMGLLQTNLKEILGKLAEETAELQTYLGSYHFPENFLGDPVLVRKENRIILQVESSVFQDKKLLTQTPLKSLNQDYKTLWQMSPVELPKASLFSKKDYKIRFIYPFASIDGE